MLTTLLALLLLASPPPTPTHDVADGRNDSTRLPFGLVVGDFYRDRK